jgi:hypothetical protein
VCGFDQRLLEGAVAFAQAPTLGFADALILAGAKVGPRDQITFARQAAADAADFGKEDFGHAPVAAGDLVEALGEFFFAGQAALRLLALREDLFVEEFRCRPAGRSRFETPPGPIGRSLYSL